METAREPRTNSRLLSTDNGVCVQAWFAGNGVSIAKNRNDGTGPVVRTLRELIALPLSVLRTSLFQEPMETPLPAARASSLQEPGQAR